jgi:D-3-phosphoglycerate dehydrogenase
MPRIVNGPLRRALIVENPHKELDQLLIEGGMEVVRIDKTPDEDELIRLLGEHKSQILFKRSQVPVTRRVLESAPDLLVVQLCAIGDDSVDKAAAAELGVMVFNDPVSNGRSVVELVVGHLVGLSRRLYESYDQGRAGVWDKSSTDRFEIQGKVLGIYGLGNIGRAVAKVRRGALGMKVRFFDSRALAREVGVEMGWEGRAEPPRRSSPGRTSSPFTSRATDVAGQSNRSRLNRELLFLLGSERPGVEPPAVHQPLSRLFYTAPRISSTRSTPGRVRRAAVDVFPKEPGKNGPGWENPYAHEPRIATTPHIGAATQEGPAAHRPPCGPDPARPLQPRRRPRLRVLAAHPHLDV